MAEFFKQLLAQLSAIWQKLSLQQKIITSSLVGLTILGLSGLLMWSQNAGTQSGMATLYSDLALEEAADITEKLDEGGYEYTLENNGRSIRVTAKKLYEIRMALAREGLPRSHGIGYEIFDKSNLGMTDFVQKVNAQRALEGELKRTIEELEEVTMARVHLVIPKPSIFLEEQNQTKASVILKTNTGRALPEDKVRGITFLVASSVEGLDPQQVSIIDSDGKLLSNPYGDDETALVSSRNIELQHKVENYLEKNAGNLLAGVLGPEKVKVKIAADLNFNQVEKTIEEFNPESRVVRSEERKDENTKNAPDGDHQREHSTTNYEIDKTIQHIVQEMGNIKRLTISVVVDGAYSMNEQGDEEYVPRSAEEMQNIEDVVKNAVGYDLARGDQITVSNLKFDNEFLRKQQAAMHEAERREQIMTWIKMGLLGLLGITFLLFLRHLTSVIADAMNPPLPQMEALAPEEEVVEDIPEDVQRSSEILERVEMLTREEPINIASIIRQWLRESSGGLKRK